MAQYRVTCRGTLGPATVAKLSEAGVDWATGGPIQLDSERHRHHLLVEAVNEAQPRDVTSLEAGDGDASDIEVLGESDAS